MVFAGRKSRTWDHPRVCREKFQHISGIFQLEGSPPRMRGKELSVSAHCHICGITPAYAGKSEAVNGPGIAGKDHPRVCGEKHSQGGKSGEPTGSPPRMRGKENYCCSAFRCKRITPAYAGKSALKSRKWWWNRDHPRVCGEKDLLRDFQHKAVGSPPRMRGKGDGPNGPHVRTGITPAYAGKRAAVVSYTRNTEDHPRVCGEKHSPRKKRLSQTGSPPRMRGKGCASSWCACTAGITPAYAGKSRSASVASFALRDHPRVCGEKPIRAYVKIWNEGSPPRMRGKVGHALASNSMRGITPAYAGKRNCPLVRYLCVMDHPRVCGEKCSGRPERRAGQGSPPRMRGKDPVRYKN